MCMGGCGGGSKSGSGGRPTGAKYAGSKKVVDASRRSASTAFGKPKVTVKFAKRGR